jgi:hypothetical protein
VGNFTHLTGQTVEVQEIIVHPLYPQPADVGLDRLSTLTAAWLVRRQAMAEAESGSVLLIAKAALRQMLRNEL